MNKKVNVKSKIPVKSLTQMKQNPSKMGLLVGQHF